MILRTLVAIVALGLIALAMPRPADACSCAMEEDPIRAVAGEPGIAVFTGVIQPPEPLALPVLLTRWFQGGPTMGLVGLDRQGFEDPGGGMCGTPQPPVGSEWIFVSEPNERGLYSVIACTTHADLATPEGQALLTRATEVYGPVPDPAPDEPIASAAAIPDPSPATPVQTAAAIPDPSPAETAETAPSTVGAVLPIVLGVVFAVGVAAGLALILGRRSDDAT
jgi:hypothetical protein